MSGGRRIEMRSFQAPRQRRSFDLCWLDLHLHSLVPVGPNLWQALFVVRERSTVKASIPSALRFGTLRCHALIRDSMTSWRRSLS